MIKPIAGRVPTHVFKAIPTCWKGFVFRSRTEARWAVFFAELGIEVFYEPEGFDLPDGSRYLPDFFIPQIKSWAEVKPTSPTPPEIAKAEAVVSGTKQMLLFLVGPPDFRDYVGISFDSGELTACPYRLDVDANLRHYYEKERRLFSCPTDEITEWFCSNRYRDAVYASRRERFDTASSATADVEEYDGRSEPCLTGRCSQCMGCFCGCHS